MKIKTRLILSGILLLFGLGTSLHNEISISQGLVLGIIGAIGILIVTSRVFHKWERRRYELRKAQDRERKMEQKKLDFERRRARARALGEMEGRRIHKEDEYRRKIGEKILREGIFGGMFKPPRREA